MAAQPSAPPMCGMLTAHPPHPTPLALLLVMNAARCSLLLCSLSRSLSPSLACHPCRILGKQLALRCCVPPGCSRITPRALFGPALPRKAAAAGTQLNCQSRRRRLGGASAVAPLCQRGSASAASGHKHWPAHPLSGWQAGDGPSVLLAGRSAARPSACGAAREDCSC